MIVILASRWDSQAEEIAASWAHRSAAVLTPSDLSVRGWRQYLGADGSGTLRANAAVMRRRVLPHAQITGVLTRLPCVTDGEIIEIAAHDRVYAAAEMTAFLLFWLSQLKCPVLNAPTPMCLSGPSWRAEQWTHAAARAGMPVQAIHRDTRSPCPEPPPGSSPAVTVVGRRTFGDADADLKRKARLLAELAGVTLLTVRFSSAARGATFVGADTFPPLDDAAAREAALDHLCATSAVNS